MAQLVDNKYKPREWPKDFIEVIIDFMRKPDATKCRNHPAINFISHRAKRVARIHRGKFESNLDDVI